jgi:hypothetical protein
MDSEADSSDDCMAEERDSIYEPSVARQRHLERQPQRRRQHMVLPPSRQCRELRRSATARPPRLSHLPAGPSSTRRRSSTGHTPLHSPTHSPIPVVLLAEATHLQAHTSGVPGSGAVCGLLAVVAGRTATAAGLSVESYECGRVSAQVPAAVRGVSQPQLRGRGGDLLLAAVEETDPAYGAAISAGHFGGVGSDAAMGLPWDQVVQVCERLKQRYQGKVESMAVNSGPRR